MPSPINGAYVKRVLDRLFEQLDAERLEYSEALTEIYCTAASSEGQRTACRTFVFDAQFRVSVMHSLSMISDGTTGLSVWEAAVFFAEYVFTNQSMFRGREVLELGSGTGLAGLACSKVAKQVTLTDFHPSVLQLLEQNAQLCPNGNVQVQGLDWGDCPSLISRKHWDVVVAADVVYDPELSPSLADLIAQLSFQQCFLALTKRNPSTLDHFLECLGTHRSLS